MTYSEFIFWLLWFSFIRFLGGIPILSMDQFTTKDLKEQLRRRGLKTSGRKKELFSRFSEALSREYGGHETSNTGSRRAQDLGDETVDRLEGDLVEELGWGEHDTDHRLEQTGGIPKRDDDLDHMEQDVDSRLGQIVDGLQRDEKSIQDEQAAIDETVLDNVPLKDDVHPEDSASQGGLGSKVSGMSRRSGSSVLSQKKLAAAKRAALEAKMSKLKELEAVEQEEERIKQEKRIRQERNRQEQFKLKQRKDRLLLEAELAAAQAEERALSIVGEEQINKTSEIDRAKTGNSLNEDKKETDRTSVSVREKTREPYREVSNIPANNDQGLIETLISCNLKGLMPNQEVRKFDGDYTMYHLFIRSFESVISSRLTSDGERLHYLEQYTVGRANEIVRACLHLDPSEGYKRAREMLKKRYGNPERIVTAFVDRVLNWKDIGRDDVEGLDEFSVMLASCRNAVSCVPHGASELQNPETMRKILNKLPFNVQDRWRREADDIMTRKGREVTFNDLVNYIEREARVMKNPLFGKHLFSNREKDKTPRAKNNSANIQAEQRVGHRASCNNTKGTLACWYHKGSHIVDNCDQIRSMAHQEKIDTVRKLGLCFGCLRSGHRSKDCRSRKTCEDCQGNHPSLLHKTISDYPPHLDEEVDSGIVNQESSNSQKSVAIYTSIQGNSCRGMSVVPVRVRTSNGRETLTSAFLDNGSSATFCTKSLLKRLGLKGYAFNNINLFTTTIHGKREMKCALVPGISVCDLSGNNIIALPPLYAIDSIPVEKGDLVEQQDVQKWEHLRGLELPESNAEVELMIGTNVPHALEPHEVINSTSDFEPYAIKTKLGWVICGMGEDMNYQASVHRVSVSYGQRLDKILVDSYNKDFNDLASFRKELSIEDKQWLGIVEKGCRRVAGKYEIPLPLCSNIENLPESKPAALRRSWGLRKKLLRDGSYASQYSKFMNEMLDKGYAEPVQKGDKGEESSNVWYIPHFGVRHSDKPDKVRVVFDCAARINGIALNDILLQGPDMINSLLGVLLRFRMNKYAYTADIETMFYQVQVPTCDRDYLRFLWWEDGKFTEEPNEFRMCVHLFGACSSPSIANFALKQVVHDFGQDFSDNACHTVTSSFYVDDCLRSEETLQELIQNSMEVKCLCELGGFNLTKFVSPSEELLHYLLPDAEEGKNNLVETKTLGVRWDLIKDEFGVVNNFFDMPKTKRALLSFIASIYDPLGIVAPLVIEGRIIMQDLCRMQVHWDDRFSGDFERRIIEWAKKCSNLGTIKVPRCLKPSHSNNVSSMQLHFFSDASQSAYGAVAYLRVVDKADSRYCVFVLGRARVAPLKSVSIPRLELTAATLAIKMNHTIMDSLQLHLDNVFFWTDSTTVLRYIRNDKVRYQTFVANRVALIRDGSEKEQWRYVNTDLNPADEASRAKQTSRWTKGPEFLLLDSHYWPREPRTLSDDVDGLEVKREATELRVVHSDSVLGMFFKSYSVWVRLLRAVAWLIKFKEYLSQGKNGSLVVLSTNLSVGIMELAEYSVIKAVQKEAYADEIARLEIGQCVSRSSPLVKLKPMLLNGILRVGGRLDAADLSFNEAHPIILPNREHVTELIISHYHCKVGHMGRMSVLAQVRSKYWIIRGNAAVRSVLGKCVDCRKLKRQGY